MAIRTTLCRMVAGGASIMVAWAAAAPTQAAPTQAVPTVVAAEVIADGPMVVDGASTTSRIRYTSTSVRGVRTEMTGTLTLPSAPAPDSGWPLAVWNHMTVGGADHCAPSTATTTHPELPRMTSGDRVIAHLLDAGFAVVRPDFEGIGGSGPHPYLIAGSLARSTIDAAVAVSRYDSRISHDVVVAGHSEGAVAALSAGAREAAQWNGLRLRAVAALAPPTEVAAILDALSGVPLAGPAINELVGLAALLGSGAAAADPDFADLMTRGGLSRSATVLLPHIEDRCYAELTEPGSFGGLAPTQLLGPAGAQMKAKLVEILERNDVRNLHIPAQIPVRVDAGFTDTVAPQPLVTRLVDTYRHNGMSVTYVEHPVGHAGVATEPGAATDIARWLIAQV
ncbi:alpha/beta hydrolase [Gordonia tangerina]|uniref:Lipase family protein n=1 Tax=Gordonia tangerina TaxID=2911060 RepID=A0ABS9DJV8_9ACTN|nr:lipase family protein [Gordonia tangerina]MCF3938889.1 lipase family protein [Gordonia tangerina]